MVVLSYSIQRKDLNHHEMCAKQIWCSILPPEKLCINWPRYGLALICSWEYFKSYVNSCEIVIMYKPYSSCTLEVHVLLKFSICRKSCFPARVNKLRSVFHISISRLHNSLKIFWFFSNLCQWGKQCVRNGYFWFYE